ncbi:MAG TPA: hydrolase [Rhodospirillaceae bacterium]|nr:hydrolase [Rhodospirillaceae bacterium]MAX60990.1 hydrolase [Rhodospirillaceae bacterium]MBB55728.1 hydrolase [Rhodospirillaceae bacterium]HAE03535.1 hydrolase [Rhodospirillaceae bacterium]
MIIFDCDGVLVDTERLSNRILAEQITRAGHPMTTEESIRRYKGGRIRTLPPLIEAEFNLKLPDDWLDQFFARQFAALEAETQAIPGVSDVVDQLIAKGTGFCVASQASVAKMRITLGRSGLWDRVEGRIFSADMVERPKPFPDLFLHAADTMGWPARQVTVIEDSTTGVRAAVAAGMRVIGFCRDTNPDELRAAGASDLAQDMAGVSVLLGLL